MNAVSLEKFRELPREQQVAIHEEMKKSIGIEGILNKWDLSRSKYYYLLKKLKLNENKQPENGHQEFEASPTPNKPKPNNLSALDFEESPTPMAIDTKERMPYSLSVQGSSKLVSAMMKSLEDIISTSDSNYSVNITVKEF